MGYLFVGIGAKRNIINAILLILFMVCTMFYINNNKCGLEGVRSDFRNRQAKNTLEVLFRREDEDKINKDLYQKLTPNKEEIKVVNLQQENDKRKSKNRERSAEIKTNVKEKKLKVVEVEKEVRKSNRETYTTTTKRTTTLTTTSKPKTRPTTTTVHKKSKRKHEKENIWSEKWPRVNINNCAHMEYMNRGINAHQHFKTWPYPRTGIVSFPGSGNTWARHLIQQASGLWTGSVYRDRSLYTGGFLAELDNCDDNSTVAIKAHYPLLEKSSYCKFDRAIILVRDPYRAVLAEFNWRSTSRHTGVADPRLFKTKIWKDHVIQRTNKWLITTKEWIARFVDKRAGLEVDKNPYIAQHNAHKRLLLVSYERMKRNETKEMERVMKFLDLPVFRKHCVEEEADGNFRRKSKESESIECLFNKFNLVDEVQSRVKNLVEFALRKGIGDISAEFEGPGGNITTEKCNFL